MSEKCIVHIIHDLGFCLTQQSKNNDIHEIYFQTGFKKDLGSVIQPEMLFVCKTKDFKDIDTNVNVGFYNVELINIKSPDEAIRAFEWLKETDNNLKKLGYTGKFNAQGYNPQSYTYIVNTKFMEDFKKTLSEFNTAYFNISYNSKKKYTEYRPTELKNLINLSNPEK